MSRYRGDTRKKQHVLENVLKFNIFDFQHLIPEDTAIAQKTNKAVVILIEYPYSIYNALSNTINIILFVATVTVWLRVLV